MEDYRLEQSGQEVQHILNGAAMQVDLTAENERAELAEQTLQGNIDAEALARENADGVLQGHIDDEETRAKTAEKQNADDIDAIKEKIPTQASSSNQLADKDYVEDLVSTSSATFRGTFNLVSDLHLTVDASYADIAAALGNAIAGADNNDFAFVMIPTSVDTPNEIARIEKYKFNGSVWGFEYVLNNSGFTAAQWAAINSGITSALVTKLGALPSAADLAAALLAKQDKLTFDQAPTPSSTNPVTSGGVYTAIDDEKGARINADAALQQAIEAILLLIPSAATALNQLADKAFVNSSIATATATFRGTFNLVSDLQLAIDATHADIAAALLNAISTADNNDYAFVQIPTSVDTPTEIRVTERYKFNGTAWSYEYDLNNSGFTAAQWAAINSGITALLVTKLSNLPNATELAALFAGKQNVLTFDNAPVNGSDNPVKSGGLYDLFAAIDAKIPTGASANNKLVAEDRLAAYVGAIIGALDATFDLTSTDGHVTLRMTQTDGVIASLQILTSDIASASALTTLGGQVSTNADDIAALQALYNALQQSAPQVIEPSDTWPVANPSDTVIYRVIDRVNTPPQYYSDYMWNGTEMVLMATYNNAIDAVPTAGSDNLVKSGGVFDSLLDIRENIGLLTFQLRDFSDAGWIPSTNVAEANLLVASLEDYESYVVSPASGYTIAGITFDSKDGANPIVLREFATTPIDFVTLSSNYAYFGVVARKADRSDISSSELVSLVSVSEVKKKDIAENIGYTPNEYLESIDVQSAIDELAEKVFEGDIQLTFQLRDFGDNSWVDSTTRAEANLEVAILNDYNSFIVTPNTGYQIAAIHFNSLDLSTGASVLREYQSEPIDFKSLSSDRTYYGVMIRKLDSSVINQSELTSLVTISAEKGDSNLADVVFMSVSGNDSNDGSYNSPVLTIGKALSLSDNVVIKEGQYDNFALSLANISNRNISIKADSGKQVILMNRRIYATTGSTGSLVSGKTNVYQIESSIQPSGWLYQHLVNDVNTIIARNYSHPAQRGKEYRCDSTILRNAADSYSTLSDALNFIESEAASNRYYFFYDSDNQMLYFSRPQTPSTEHPICGSKGACITGNNDRNKIQLTGLDFYYGTVDFKNVEDSEVADCSSKYTFGWGAFHWTDCKNLKYIRCEAAGNCYGTYGDGFNGDSTIMTVDPYTSAVHLIDCWAHDNHDDGYSDHNGCNCNVLGGLYEYNRKGGVTPAAGSHCTVLGTISRNNINGFYYVVNNSDQGIAGNVVFNDCLAYNNEHSGFRCEGTNNYAECINCISHDNAEYGYMGVIKARNCYAANNNTAEKDANVTVIQVSALS